MAKAKKLNNFLDFYNNKYGTNLKSKKDVCEICKADWEKENKVKWNKSNCNTCEI